jgi:hypothetical protein
VKSADYDSLGSRPQQIIEALTHLPGGALCERHGRDTVRFDTTLGDEPGDTMCEGSRLARARTGESEQNAARDLSQYLDVPLPW